MKVLVNCYSMPLASEGAGGAGKYLQALLPELARRVDLTIIASKNNISEYEIDGAVSIIPVENTGSTLKGIVKENDIYFNPTNGFSVKDIGTDIAVISVVHDLQHCRMPHFFRDGSFESRNKEYGFQIARSDGVVAISNWEKKNFRKYYNANHSKVIYHSSYLYDAMGLIDAKPAIDFDDYYIYPAVGWPHKNHTRLIEAVKYANRYHDRHINLILTGLVEHEESKELWVKALNLYKSSNIKVMDHIPDYDLAALMSHAKGMFFPSLYEGFGIPLIDAMNYMLPVLAADNTCIREVTGGKVDYFRNVDNSLSMAKDIAKFDEAVECNEYSTEDAKEVASRYSTERMTSELIDYFGEVLLNKKNNVLSNDFSTKNMVNEKPEETITLMYLFDNTTSESLRECVLQLVDLKSHVNNINNTVVIVEEDVLANENVREFISNEKIDDLYYVFLPDESISSYEKAFTEAGLYFANTEYFLMSTDIASIESWSAHARQAVAFLDYFQDVFSVDFDANYEKGRILVDMPSHDGDCINEYLSVKDNDSPKEWIKRFCGRLIRTSICDQVGYPGTLALLSRDLCEFKKIKGCF